MLDLHYLSGSKQELAKQFTHTMSRLHTVDPSTITETSHFRIQSRLEDKTPHTVIRLRDNQTFCIDDLVSNNTAMKGKITGFHITVSEDNGELIMWIDHTWSKVGMALEDIERLTVLPCRHQFGDRVLVFFVSDQDLITIDQDLETGKLYNENNSKFKAIIGNIHAVHFLPRKVKYDVDLTFTEGASTRIYNIDSIFVFPDKR